MNIWFIPIGDYVTSGRILSSWDLLDFNKIKKIMDSIIKKANKFLPFGLKAEKLVPFFIAAKLFSFAGFAIFMMNR